MKLENAIGEIVESGTASFVAQCLEIPRQFEPKLYDPPPFGSFVKIEGPQSAPSIPAEAEGEVEEADPFANLGLPVRPKHSKSLPNAVYALVCGSMTTSVEPSRRPSAFGLNEDDLRAQQPQIFELLRTEFTGLLIAYSEGEGKELRRHLPPKPPRIHALVMPCSVIEVQALTEDLGFLRALLTFSSTLAGVPSDELVAACLRHARDAHGNDRGFLLMAGKTLALLLADDYERLQAILRNVL